MTNIWSLMSTIQNGEYVPVNNFLIAKNMLTIAQKEILLCGGNGEQIVITTDVYRRALAEWRHFRITGQLDDHWNHVSDLERSFYAFCSRANQPFMFVTADEVVIALGDSGTPYILSDQDTTRQIYRTVYREYFSIVSNKDSWKNIYRQPYICRCVGEMTIWRRINPELFDGLDEELESIKLVVRPESTSVTADIANQENIVIYRQRYPLDDPTGFPRSHLDILTDVIKTFTTDPIIE